MQSGIGPGYLSFVSSTDPELDFTAVHLGAKRKMEAHGETIYTFDTQNERDAFEGVVVAQGYDLAKELDE